MAEHSKIEWVKNGDGSQRETWNPIRARNRETGKLGHFRIHKSPGCKFCYAERMQPRFGNPIRFAAQDADKVEMFLDENTLHKPLGWKKPRMVFVCSMTDLFLDDFPDDWIREVWINMALAERHTFQVLTKRPERMRKLTSDIPFRDGVLDMHEIVTMGDRAPDWPLPNVWLGVSVEDQERADERIPILLDTPAAVRFVSAEPLLSPVFFPWFGVYQKHLDWVIVGGEWNEMPAHE